MVYSYTPAYYSTLHDSITTLCKNILPFSFKKRRLPSSEHKLSEMQSENLKWQQDSFHQMLNLMGLHKEGILAESEVSAFRTHLLETLISAPVHQENPTILRDKLLFLQELLYAKCITLDEYRSSKKPLLQRIAVQGVEIDGQDVIVGPSTETKHDNSSNPADDEWSVIDLKDDNCVDKENSCHLKNKSTVKQHIKGAASAFGFGSLPHKGAKGKHERSIFDKLPQNSNMANEYDQFRENPFWDSHLRKQESETKSILMSASSPPPPPPSQPSKESASTKRKPFRALFTGHDGEDKSNKSGKRQWGGLVDGLKKWKKNDSDDETAPLSLNERSCNERYSCLGEGPDTKLIKRKLHSDGSPSDFFIDKVLGAKIKNELSRIQSELSVTNPNMKFSSEQIEAISTKLPVDKAELKHFFPKTWCDQYGDLVLDVVKKEFKDHVGEMEKLKNAVRERHTSTARWTTFDDDDYENSHPNLFQNKQHVYEENPFYQSHHEMRSYHPA